MIIDSPIISGSYAASGSLDQLGNVVISGSLTVTGDITGNITGSATNAVSASFATTAVSASYAANTTSASYAAAATSASYANNATSASYAANATSASFSATASYLENYIPPFPFTGSAGISGSLTVNGNITAQTLIVQTITSSEDFVTGSTHFGSIIDNTHQFTGSVTISGSLAVNGSSAVLTNQTGAMSVATASYAANAVSASYAANAETLDGLDSTALAVLANSNTFAAYQTITDYVNVTGPSGGDYKIGGTSIFNSTAGNLPKKNVMGGFADSTVSDSGTKVTISNSDGLSVTNPSGLGVIEATGAGGGDFRIQGQTIFNTTTNAIPKKKTTGGYQDSKIIDNGSLVTISSNTDITGSLKINSGTIYGNLEGTASLATTASYALTASYASNVPVTASYADNASSASYALTSSYSLAGGGFPYSGSAEITGSLLISNLEGTGARYLVTDASGNITAQTASAAIRSTQTVVATAGQTTFNITNGYTTGLVDVFINGTKLNSSEFTDTNGTTIVLATGSFVNDVVEFEKYFPASGVTNNALRQQTTFTASADQTVFSASYTPGLLDIFYNGSRLSNGEYTANTGTYFTLATGSAEGDILDVFVYSYQVGAFSGIGGAGVENQFAYFNTSNSITSSTAITISGANAIITGSLLGTASFADSASNATTASYVLTAQTASYVLNAQTASYVLTAQTASYVLNAQTASFVALAQSASNAVAAQTASYVLNAISSSFASTASSADDLLVRGTLTAQTLVVQTITSSVDFVTGSTRFGSISENTHQFTGSVSVSGSIISSSPITGSGFSTTANVNLGNFDLTSKYLISDGSAGLGGVISIRQDATYLAKGNGYSSIASSDVMFDFFGYTGASTYKNFTLRFDGLTDNTRRTYTLPDNSGTLALLSGSQTFNDATTFASSLTGSNVALSGNVVFNRASTSAGNNIEWRTANTLNWYIGTRGLVDNNFYFVNEGLGANNLILNASTGAATFSSSVTATQFAAGSASPTYPFNSTSAAGTQAMLNSTRTGGGGIIIQNNGSDRCYIGTANWTGISGFDTTTTDLAISNAQNSSIVFAINAANASSSEKMRITSGGTVQPGANGTQDLGTSSLRWATVYTSDLDMSNGIGDYTIVEGEEDLFLYNNKTNKVFKFLIQEVDPSEATPKMKK